MSQELKQAMETGGGGCPPQSVLLAYRFGRLSGSDQHRVERHLLACDLCGEALEGLEGVTEPETAGALEDLKRRLAARLEDRDRKRRGAWIWLSSAAAVALLITGAYFMMRAPEPPGEDLFTQNYTPAPAPAMEEKAAADSPTLSRNSENGPIASGNGVDAVDREEPIRILWSGGEKENLEVKEPDFEQPNENWVVPKVMEEESMDETVADEDAPSPDPNANVDAPKATHTVTLSNASAPPQDGGRGNHAFMDNARVEDKEESREIRTATPGKANAPKGNPKTPSVEKKATTMDDQSFAVLAEKNDAPSVGDGVTVQDEKQKGLVAYQAKDYPTSIQELKNCLKTNPSDSQCRFFLGQAYLADGQTSNAAKEFQILASETKSPYREDAAWYLALAQIKLGKKDSARKILLQLDVPGGKYQTKASDLLRSF